MNHIMLDIETLGLTPGCAILTIGAVLFDINQKDLYPNVNLLPKERIFYRRVDPYSNIRLELYTEAITLQWWGQQCEKERYEAFEKAPRYDLFNILIDLNNWYKNTGANKIWAHGATFDIPIIEEVYRRCSLTAPWGYKHHRDTRTLFDVANYSPKTDPSHNALQDAYDQVRAVQHAYSKLKGYEDYQFLREMRDRLENSEISFVKIMIDDWISELQKNF